MSLAKLSAKITLLGFVGMISSIVVDAIMVAFLGLSSKTDSFFVAATIPMALVTIVGLQAQKVAQPLFIHVRSTQGDESSWGILNNAIILGTALTAVICAIGVIAAGPIIQMQLTAPDAATQGLAKQLTMLFFCLPILACPSALMGVALNSVGDFTLTGMMRTIENISKMLLAIALFSRLGIFVVPIGSMIAALVQIVLLYRVLRRHGYRFHFRISKTGFTLRQTISRSIYPLIGHGMSLGTETLQNALATSLGPGALSALRLATRMIDAFTALVASSFVTAVAPEMSRHSAVGDTTEMKKSMLRAMKLLAFVAIPSMAWLIAFGGPCLSVLFERRNFTSEDTALVASLMALMSPYILLSRAYGLAELPFYGAQDTRTPLVANVALAVMYCILIWVLSTTMGERGFAAGRSIAYLGGFFALAVLLHRKYGNPGWSSLIDHFLRVGAAAAVSGISGYTFHVLLQHYGPRGFVWSCVTLAISGIFAVAVFAAAAIVSGVATKAFLQSTANRAAQMIGIQIFDTQK